MNYTYQEIQNELGETIILRSDGANIPTDPANTDYQAYLDRDKPKRILPTVTEK
jgi:hypothetical protein